MSTTIREQLESLSDPAFREFTKRLLPGVANVIGVRLPVLRKLSRQIAASDWRAYLSEQSKASDPTFEERMLEGMVIGCVKEELSEILPYIKSFVGKIDNWSVCDSFCSGLKVAREYPKEMWDYTCSCLSDDREYTIRFGLVMALDYYADEAHADEFFRLTDKILCEHYYVKMAAAWAISIYYVKIPEKTMVYLKDNELDDWTYNKALQKITESRCIDDARKQEIRCMRRGRTRRPTTYRSH